MDKILNIGIFLSDIGVKNWALTRIQALNVLDKLHKSQVGILGGDVYEVVDGCFQTNYDNWYTEKKNDESIDEFYSRSFEEAKLYLEKYQSNVSDNILFTIVPDV